MDYLVDFFRYLIWRIFPYNSRGERYLRTLYHNIQGIPIYVEFMINRSRASYARWLKQQDLWLASKSEEVPGSPKVSFLLSIPRDGMNAALQTIQSITGQTVDGWKIIINLEATSPEEMGSPEFNKLIENVEQITILCNTHPQLEELVRICQTDYLVCCSPGDIFSQYLIGVFQKRYQAYSGCEIYYYDSDHSPEQDPASVPLFKPEIYSPELHLSINYLSGAILKKKCVQSVLELVYPDWGIEIQEWEMLLCLCRMAPEMVHIPKVLMHRSHLHPSNKADAGLMLGRHLSRIGLASATAEYKEGSFRLQWVSAQPRVSIIIPTKNNYLMIRNLLDSLFTLTDYPNFEVILVDNGSSDQKVLQYYKEITASKPVRVVNYPKSFNYSQANNLGASLSDAELLLFMNNDMRVISPDWLAELTRWAMLPGVGVVGTKLLRRDRTIQHAGIVIGLQGFVGHLYLNVPEHFYGLLGSMDWYRNFNAVTGACQMIRRDLFKKLGGYDEHFQLVFSDVEFCLEAIKLGYRVVYNPWAALLHFEGKSRGYNTPLKDILRGFDTMEEWLFSDDRYFSPNLTYSPIPWCVSVPGQANNRIRQIQKRKKNLERRREKNYFSTRSG